MLAYIPATRTLFHTMGKAASSTTWHLIHSSLTNTTWRNAQCGNIHNKSRSCWNGTVIYPHYMRPDYSLLNRILFTDDNVRRVAIQRDPYERLISAYKSKYTCESDLFRTDVKDRANKVPLLYRHAGMNSTSASQAACLSVSKFAVLLDEIRRGVGKKDGVVESVRKLDNHIRPQSYFFDFIPYDVVVDVKQLSNLTVLHRIVGGFPHAEEAIQRVVADREEGNRHSSGDASLNIPERAAVSLYKFASLSKQGPLTFPLSNN